jgi:hypothetical protein
MAVLGRNAPTSAQRFETMSRVSGELEDRLGTRSVRNHALGKLPASHVALIRVFRVVHALGFSADWPETVFRLNCVAAVWLRWMSLPKCISAGNSQIDECWIQALRWRMVAEVYP